MMLQKDEENRIGWESLFELFIEKEQSLEEKLSGLKNNQQEEILPTKPREPAAGRRV